MTPHEAAEALVDTVAVGATAPEVFELVVADGEAYQTVEEAVRQERGLTHLNLSWDLLYLESPALGAIPQFHPMHQYLPKEFKGYKASQADALAVARQAAYTVGLIVGRRLGAGPTPDGGGR